MTCMTLRAAIAMLLTGAVMAAAGLSPGVAVAAKSSKCQRLKGRDIAPASSVKLVRRANADDGTDLFGCVLPRGPVQHIASSADLRSASRRAVAQANEHTVRPRKLIRVQMRAGAAQCWQEGRRDDPDMS